MEDKFITQLIEQGWQIEPQAEMMHKDLGLLKPIDIINSRLERVENNLVMLARISMFQHANRIEPKIVTTKELCEYLRVNETTIIRWKQKGKIPYFNIGTAVRFNLNLVLAALEAASMPRNTTGGGKYSKQLDLSNFDQLQQMAGLELSSLKKRVIK